MELYDWQVRVVEEHDQLNERINKLIDFTKTDTFKNLPSSEQNRMIRQRIIMRQYLEVLKERIQNFRDKKDEPV